ncbi:MAG: hypothetical protein ABJC62_06280 [Frankiaceae bacterium]
MPPDQDEKLNDLPLLYIPAYPPPALAPPDKGDTGLRPVAPVVPVWASAGLQALTAFQPGSDLTVQVTVGNWQGGNSDSSADVAVWWSPPVSGKPVLDPKKFLGFSSIPVSPHGGRATTPPMTGTIPSDSGPHICLFALVCNALDMPETALVDPVNDRHWAQHNLIVVAGPAPQPIGFFATNASGAPARFDLHVRSVGQEMLPGLAETQQAEPVQQLGQFRLQDRDTGGEAVGERSVVHPVTLEAGEQREMQLSITLPDPPPQGAFTAFEVLQLQDDTLVGGLGIVVRG